MKKPVHLIVLLLALMLSACATSQNHYDPIEPVNRITDKANDSIDRVTLKPLAKGYTIAVPKPMRTAVSNFFDNAAYMNTVLNDFLQGKGQQGMGDLMRFLINSTLGVGGLVDVASPMGFEKHNEDLGQTLATWGVSQGAYIVYPLMGPNSVRNTSDFITSTATDPFFWAGFVLAPYVTIPITVLEYIDKRARLLSASNMRDELALDPYVFTREAWRQRRNYLIYDGNPPVASKQEDDGFEEDDFDSEDTPSEQPQPKTRIHLESAPPQPSPQSTHGPTAAAPTPKPDQQPETGNAPTAHLRSQQSPATPATAPASSTAVSVQRTYTVFLSSHYSEAEAAAEQAHITKLGVHADIYPVVLKQHRWYRLRAGSFASKAKARAEMEKLEALTGLNDAWLEVSR